MKVKLIEVNVVVVNTFFEEKPDIAKVLPEFRTGTNNYQLPKRVKTSNMSLFFKTWWLGWISKKGGEGKGESQPDQLLCKVFEVLLCRCLYIMGYSWECGRLLLRICHNDFWFCGILTDRLVSKIFWCYWLYERSTTFAWFSQKLKWFRKNK